MSADGLHADLKTRYIVLAAAFCIIKYTQFAQSIVYIPGGVTIRWEAASDRMSIDASCIYNLEVVADRRSGKHKMSLFGVVNATKTKVGARLLRGTLMAPPVDRGTIETRFTYDVCVSFSSCS